MSAEIKHYISNLSRELNIENVGGVIGHELELIALVRNCPFIYDNSRHDFKDFEKREACWMAIANILNSPAEDCQGRWKNMRDHYSKIRRLVNANDPEALKLLHWPYYNDMKFLDEHIKTRRRRFNKSFKTDKQNFPNEISEENSKIDWSDESSKTCNDFDTKFIQLVKSNPVLYSKDCKDDAKEEETWVTISNIVGATVSECRNQWKFFRNRYGKERKKMNETGVKKTWKYFEDLSFLDSHIKRRMSSHRPMLPKPDFTAYINTVDSTDSNSDIIPKMEFIDPAYTDCVSVQNSDPISMSPKSLVGTASDGSVKASVQIHANEALSMQDEDDLFGQSIAAELKRISGRRKKMKLKADIFKLLYDAESESS